MLVQTTLATLGAAGLAALQDAIRSVAVFDEAAVLMWNSPGLVFGLFVLIADAWGGAGSRAVRPEQPGRDVRCRGVGVGAALRAEAASRFQFARYSMYGSTAAYGLLFLGLVGYLTRNTYAYVWDAREAVSGDFLVAS